MKSERKNSKVLKNLFKNKNFAKQIKNNTNKKPNIFLLLTVGLVIGFANGFWGGGGGMICVPTLTWLVKLPEKVAHATTILIMLPLSVASLVIYAIKGAVPWANAGIITGGFVVGGVIGALLLKKINNTLLRVVFSLVIIAGGIKMLI